MFELKKINFEKVYWLGLFVLLIYLFYGHILCIDDVYYGFTEYRIKLFKDYFYGSWVVPLDNLILYYIPNKLSVNLQSWAQTVGAVLQTVVLTVLFGYFSKFFSLANVSRLQNLVLTSFMVMIFFLAQHCLNFIDFVIYGGFFRFILPSVLFVIWIYYLYKIIKNEDVSLFCFSCFSVLTASSSEVVGSIMVMSSAFLLCGLREEVPKRMWFALSFSLLGFVILISSIGFRNHFDMKFGIHSAGEAIKTLFPFLKVYLLKFVFGNSVFLAVCGWLIRLNFQSVKQFRREIMLSLSLIFSIFIFAFALIFLGKSHYSGGYWVVHRDLYTIFYIIFLTVIILLSLNFLQKLENISNKIIKIVCCILLPLFIISCVHLKNSFNTIKRLVFVRDEMVLHYLVNNKDIILPLALRPNFEYTVISHIYVNPKKFLKFYPFHRKIEMLSVEENTEVFKDKLLNYYIQVYGYKRDKEEYFADFIDGNIAMKYYFDNGGIISKKNRFGDLEIKQ